MNTGKISVRYSSALYSIAKERGEEDIRIVGFDYSNIYDVFNPPITYVLQPLKEISHEAAEYLFRLIDMQEKGEDIRPVKDKIILKATLQ